MWQYIVFRLHIVQQDKIFIVFNVLKLKFANYYWLLSGNEETIVASIRKITKAFTTFIDYNLHICILTWCNKTQP